MRSEPYWPLVALTGRQQKAYDEAFAVAIAQAGGINRLAAALGAHAGDYLSHQAIRNWRRSTPAVQPQWALVIEDYTHGEANFFDMVPWLRERFKQKEAA